jgi:hypothetical protein
MFGRFRAASYTTLCFDSITNLEINIWNLVSLLILIPLLLGDLFYNFDSITSNLNKCMY